MSGVNEPGFHRVSIVIEPQFDEWHSIASCSGCDAVFHALTHRGSVFAQDHPTSIERAATAALEGWDRLHGTNDGLSIPMASA